MLSTPYQARSNPKGGVSPGGRGRGDKKDLDGLAKKASNASKGDGRALRAQGTNAQERKESGSESRTIEEGACVTAEKPALIEAWLPEKT